MGKGSSPRPMSVPRDDFDDRFDAIFRKKSGTPNLPAGTNLPPRTESLLDDFVQMQRVLAEENLLDRVIPEKGGLMPVPRYEVTHDRITPGRVPGKPFVRREQPILRPRLPGRPPSPAMPTPDDVQGDE